MYILIAHSKLEIDRYIGLPIFKHLTIIEYRLKKKKKKKNYLSHTQLYSRSITSSEMCSLYLTHSSTHTWSSGRTNGWTYFTLLFIYFITVNKYRFCISFIEYINVQIIGIGYEKINIGRSLFKTQTVVMNNANVTPFLNP